MPASRHPGLFAPYGYAGDIEVNGCWLMERPQAQVDAFHANAHANAQQNVADLFDRTGAMGFTGGVTVLQEGSGSARISDICEIGPKTIENVTLIPRELTPYIAQIFAERDLLWSIADDWWGEPTPQYLKYAELSKLNPDWTRGQLMNAVLLPYAIDHVRKNLATEGAQHEQRTDDGQPTACDARESGDGGPSGAVDASPPGTPGEGTG